MEFSIRYSNAAEKYFKKLKDTKLKSLYKSAIEKIKCNPHIGTAKKGDLAGIYGYDIYYQRTNYELAYCIYEKDEKVVVVIMAGTRGNFYEQLKRYIYI